MIVEYWGIERNGVVSTYHKVTWRDREHSDKSVGEMLRSDTSIDCIHRLKDKPTGAKVIGQSRRVN